MKPKNPIACLALVVSFPIVLSCSVLADTLWWNTASTGTWSTTTNWWTTDAGTTTPATSPASGDSVVFNGTGQDGDTVVQLNADAAATGITFNNSGTTSIGNFDATPRLLSIGSGGISMGSSAGNPSISANIALTANQNWSIYQNKILTVSGEAKGAFNLSKGGGTTQSGTWLFTTGADVNVGAIDSSGSADLGLISITDGNFAATSLTLRRSSAFNTAPTLAAPIQAATTSGLYVNGASANVILGSLNIGTANSSASARINNGTVTVNGTLSLGRKGSGSTRWDILQVSGGALDAPDTTSGIVIAQNNGSTANNAELYLSGGTTTAGRIGFGAATDTVGGNGFLILGGGTLYLDTPGIVLANTTGLYNYTIGINSGTLGAKENWASSLNMTLGANPSIKAANAANSAKNITLSGNLTGAGFTKSGGGMLDLSGTVNLTGTVGNASSADLGLIRISGGSFTAGSVQLGRSSSYSTAPTVATPVPAVTSAGFHVNSASAVVSLGTLKIGTSNSSASVRVDDGDVSVLGEVSLGFKGVSSTRWDILQVAGGSFTSSDEADGIVIAQNNNSLANNAQMYLTGGTTSAARIAFGKATDTTGGNGFLILESGDLFVGSGGITLANTTGLYSYTVALKGGTLGASAAWSSPLDITLVNSPTIQCADTLDNPFAIELAGAVSGSGGFLKSGPGTLTLSGACSYTGDTTVTEGTLSLGQVNSSNESSTVSISSGAFLNLGFGGIDTVDKLFINGVQQPATDYTSAHASGRFTGGGTLRVSTGPVGGFSTWITGTFANGNTVPGGKQGAQDDPDGDGVSNLEEYAVAGMDPTVPNGSIGTFGGNTFTIGKRLPLATDITYAIQESSDLGVGEPWQEVPAGESYINNSTTISYTLPGGPTKDFLRLKVEKP
jgi:autotransporter-associated beta strand protein